MKFGKFNAVLFSGLLLSGCVTSTEPPKEPSLYEAYDKTVEDLRLAVDRGEITVTEAERLRKEAFKKYLDELKEVRVAMEYRNY